jgi:hypothetical protein
MASRVAAQAPSFSYGVLDFLSEPFTGLFDAPEPACSGVSPRQGWKGLLGSSHRPDSCQAFNERAAGRRTEEAFAGAMTNPTERLHLAACAIRR